jgi:hypothetical protein
VTPGWVTLDTPRHAVVFAMTCHDLRTIDAVRGRPWPGVAGRRLGRRRLLALLPVTGLGLAGYLIVGKVLDLVFRHARRRTYDHRAGAVGRDQRYGVWT